MSKEKLLSLYSLEPNKETSDDFIQMIILDRCFILRFLIKIHVRSEREGDPIFSPYTNILHVLQRDLLLLENQLPFFILEKLYELIPKPNSIQPFPTLKEIAFAYLTRKLSTDPVALNNLEVYHLLHLYDLILLPKARDQSILESNQNAPSIVPTTTELMEAGIKMSAKKADNFLEVSYVHGKLQIPQIKDVTISIFHNLIVFEQCCPSTDKHFTAYTRFMHFMMNNTKDVEVLQESRIIENKLGSEYEVLKLFNQIFIIDHQNHYLTPVFKGIDAYCTTRWHRWHRYRAKFRRNYCSSPLIGISVFAATMLLLLTLLHTIFIVMSY